MSYVSKNPRFDSTIFTDQGVSSVQNPQSGSHKLVNRAGTYYVRDSSGAESPLGSGSGEVNVILNPSNAAAGWAASGSGVTVATTSTASELPLKGPTAIKLTPVSGTDYVRYRFTMPPALKNMKLKWEWFQKPLTGYASGDFKIELYTNTLSNYGGTYVELPLSTDVSGTSSVPSFNGKYTTTFDSNTLDYYELRFVRTAGTTALVVENVIIGPGIQPQGAVVGPIVEWTPSTTWTTNATWTGNWRRVGNCVKYEAYGTFTGATNAGILDITLPTGHLISSLWKGSLSGGVVSFALGSVFDATDIHGMVGSPVSTSVIRCYYSSTASGQLAAVDSSGTPVTIGASSEVRLEWELPIAAFDGSGVVNLAQNDVEYSYNSGTWDADDTTSFAYGSQGGAISGSLGALRTKRVRFMSPIQKTDKLTLEVSTEGVIWFEAGEAVVNSVPTYPLSNDTAGNYGLGLGPLNDTDVNVFFGRYQEIVTTGGSPVDWTNGFWRVKKEASGAATGFGLVSQARAGLVQKAGQLLGTNTNDSAETGHVGETIGVSGVATPANIASVTYHEYLGLVLTPGEWAVYASASYDVSSSITTMVKISTGISTSNSSYTDIFGLTDALHLGNGAALNSGSIVSVQVKSGGNYKVAANTTESVRLISYADYTGGQLRITDGFLYAVRVR